MHRSKYLRFTFWTQTFSLIFSDPHFGFILMFGANTGRLFSKVKIVGGAKNAQFNFWLRQELIMFSLLYLSNLSAISQSRADGA